MDDDLDARSAALTAAPLGCAFLAWAERLGLNAETAATPPASFHLLAEAVIEVSVWWANHAGRVRDVLAEGHACARWPAPSSASLWPGGGSGRWIGGRNSWPRSRLTPPRASP